MQEKIPPHNLSAERSVLGCILLNNGALSQVLDLEPSAFYEPKNQAVFRAMRALHMEQTPIDPVTLSTKLKMGDDSGISIAMYLSTLMDDGFVPSRVEAYKRIVNEMAVVRKTIYAAQLIEAEGYRYSGGEAENFSGLARRLIADATVGLAGGLDAIRTLDADYADVFRETMESDPKLNGNVDTGISILDLHYGGLQPGVVTILAGRPGMGKSALMRCITLNVALSGKRVLAFELEDTRKHAAKRNLARVGQLDAADLNMGIVPQDKARDLIEAINKCSNKPLWVDDSPGLTTEEISAKAFAFRETHGLDFIAIDHLLEVGDKGEEYQRITTAMSKLRNLAKQLNIPILLVTQLNRKVEDRSDKRPQLADLRQSGKIEEAARSIWFLYRDAYYTKDWDDKRLELIIAKSSHGRLGKVRLFGELKYMSIESWSETRHGSWDEQEKVAREKVSRAEKDGTWSTVRGTHEY
jgi:replicative DNA helicase